MDDLKQKQIYKILMMPISCKKEYSDIECREGKILTGQKYIRHADEDMSDFAIGFYEILYKDILKSNPSLMENSKLINNEFAGDTMNSFNSIANITPEAGKTILLRTPEEEWPLYLKQHFHRYHCLANFWLIPIDFGRKSRKKNYYDSMDIFLNKVIDEFDKLSVQYKTYFENMTKSDDFFIKNIVYQPREKSAILAYYKKNKNDNSIIEDKCNSQILIENAWSDISARAYDISESKYADELWEYFKKYHLFDKPIYQNDWIDSMYAKIKKKY